MLPKSQFAEAEDKSESKWCSFQMRDWTCTLLKIITIENSLGVLQSILGKKIWIPLTSSFHQHHWMHGQVRPGIFQVKMRSTVQDTILPWIWDSIFLLINKAIFTTNSMEVVIWEWLHNVVPYVASKLSRKSHSVSFGCVTPYLVCKGYDYIWDC